MKLSQKFVRTWGKNGPSPLQKHGTRGGFDYLEARLIPMTEGGTILRRWSRIEPLTFWKIPMFDNLKALSQLGPMMAKAREMQAKVQEIQARLPKITATGTAGGSLVTAVANGNLEIVALTYNTSSPLTDTELLADLTRGAINQALKNVKEMVQKEMEQATGGTDLGGLQNLMGQGS